VLLLRGRHGEEDEDLAIAEGTAPTFLRVSSTSFLVILVAEFGDLTQIVTANLAAKYHDPAERRARRGAGTVAVAALAIAGAAACSRSCRLPWSPGSPPPSWRPRRDQHRGRDPRLTSPRRRSRTAHRARAPTRPAARDRATLPDREDATGRGVLRRHGPFTVRATLCLRDRGRLKDLVRVVQDDRPRDGVVQRAVLLAGDE